MVVGLVFALLFPLPLIAEHHIERPPIKLLEAVYVPTERSIYDTVVGRPMESQVTHAQWLRRSAVWFEAKNMGVDPQLAVDIAWCESRWREYALGTAAVVGVDKGDLQVNSYYHDDPMRDMGLNPNTPSDLLFYGLTLLKNDGTRHWSASEFCWSKLQALDK